MSLRLCREHSFGVDKTSFPSPTGDWAAFKAKIVEENNRVGMIWSPTRRKDTPWIDVGKLTSVYKKSSCAIL